MSDCGNYDLFLLPTGHLCHSIGNFTHWSDTKSKVKLSIRSKIKKETTNYDR